MLRVALFFVLFGPLGAGAQTNLADGFSKLPAGASVVVMPADIELFEISAGGVTEPRADWTEIAERHLKAGLTTRKASDRRFSPAQDPRNRGFRFSMKARRPSA